MTNRGAEAYRQALEYIIGNNPGWSSRERMYHAYMYLVMTATPPLTLREKIAARWTQVRSTP